MANPSADSLLLHRQQFPTLDHTRYFNYGGQGPMARASLEAIEEAQRYGQRYGPFSTAMNQWIRQTAAATRSLMAAELGVGPENLSLTEDVTVGCNIVLWGLPWQPGDHVLLSDCEHPGVVAAVKEICRRFQVTYSLCPLMTTVNGGDVVATISQHLRSTTRLLVISHIFWNTGQVLPLQAIAQLCHRHSPEPVQVLVDAAQSVGMMPLALQDLAIDFYAFTGHKWWCGPAGLGGLYVNPAALATLHPTFIGWRGITTDAAANPTGWQPGGQRFEIATSNYSLYPGLQTAIATQHQWGTAEQRYQRLCQLSQQLWRGLNQLSSSTYQVRCLRQTPPDSGLVSFRLFHQGEPSLPLQTQLINRLEQQGYLLRSLASPSCLRACTHYLTLETEIQQLLEAIAQFLLQPEP
ncbi:MAG: aminotransferase class V-fold PLP-dependent enzyme [Cyanobacteria bacterium REEB459]|nr:aminotransferase class V-fold PLP-dependent enzyme [Cyanobacteria bacterium REEB459]